MFEEMSFAFDKLTYSGIQDGLQVASAFLSYTYRRFWYAERNSREYRVPTLYGKRLTFGIPNGYRIAVRQFCVGPLAINRYAL